MSMISIKKCKEIDWSLFSDLSLAKISRSLLTKCELFFWFYFIVFKPFQLFNYYYGLASIAIANSSVIYSIEIAKKVARRFYRDRFSSSKYFCDLNDNRYANISFIHIKSTFKVCILTGQSTKIAFDFIRQSHVILSKTLVVYSSLHQSTKSTYSISIPFDSRI